MNYPFLAAELLKLTMDSQVSLHLPLSKVFVAQVTLLHETLLEHVLLGVQLHVHDARGCELTLTRTTKTSKTNTIYK